MIKKSNGKYIISSSLLLLFSTPFIIWQMGILYFSGTTMSLWGRTPIPLTEENTIIVIALGYIASILAICLFPRKTIWMERGLMPVAFGATVLMLLPFTEKLITIINKENLKILLESNIGYDGEASDKVIGDYRIEWD